VDQWPISRLTWFSCWFRARCSVLCDVAAVGAGHCALFHPDPVVLLVQLGRLPPADLALADLLVERRFWLARRALTSSRRGWLFARCPSPAGAGA